MPKTAELCGPWASSFILCTLQGRVFNPTSSSFYQIFIGPRSRHKSIFITHWWHLWPPGCQHCFLLCAHYRAEFSTDLQIHTKYLLGHSLVPSTMSPLISDICRGPTLFLLCALYIAEFSTNRLQIHTKYSLGHAPDPSSFLPQTSYYCGH